MCGCMYVACLCGCVYEASGHPLTWTAGTPSSGRGRVCCMYVWVYVCVCMWHVCVGVCMRPVAILSPGQLVLPHQVGVVHICTWWEVFQDSDLEHHSRSDGILQVSLQ